MYMRVEQSADNGDLLVRGDAPSKASYQQGWKYMSRDEVKELLGFSLESLIPSQWPEAPGST